MKQSLALAMSIKRAKKMSKGGTAQESNATTVIPDKGFGKIIMINEHEEEPQELAEGGPVEENPLEKIMKRVRMRHMGSKA